MGKPGLDIDFLLSNNSPIDDFCGLTPNEFHRLLYEPFANESPLQFKKDVDNATLDQIPFFRIAEEFVKLVQREKQIKLTPLGAFPKKMMVELYAHKFILDEHIESGLIKLWKEADCISVLTAGITVQHAKLVNRSSGKLSITKKGKHLLLPENRLEFFKSIFSAFTIQFNWCYNDGHPSVPFPQFGFAYSMYLVDQFGDEERQSMFYSNQYFLALPMFLEHFNPTYFSSAEVHFNSCYKLRTFDRFLEWFGLVKIHRNLIRFESDHEKLVRTELFKKVFRFD